MKERAPRASVKMFCQGETMVIDPETFAAEKDR